MMHFPWILAVCSTWPNLLSTVYDLTVGTDLSLIKVENGLFGGDYQCCMCGAGYLRDFWRKIAHYQGLFKNKTKQLLFAVALTSCCGELLSVAFARMRVIKKVKKRFILRQNCHICRLSGAVITFSQDIAWAAGQVRSHGLWPVATQPYVALVCRFNGFHLRWITTHLLIPGDGMLSWRTLLTRSGQFTHKLVTCQPQIVRRARKVCWPNSDIVTTKLCRQRHDHQWTWDEFEIVLISGTIATASDLTKPSVILLLVSSEQWTKENAMRWSALRCCVVPATNIRCCIVMRCAVAESTDTCSVSLSYAKDLDWFVLPFTYFRRWRSHK